MRWIALLLLLSIGPLCHALHVIVDAGHGGVDKGTTRADLRESETALAVAKRLAAKLAHDRSFRVTMTRAEDREVSLMNRVHIAEKAGGDIFVSIHVNSSTDARARGAEFYFQNQLAADEESMFLAHKENTSPDSTADASAGPSFGNVTPAVQAILEDMLRTDRINQSSLLCKSLKSHWRGINKRKSSSLHQAPFVVISEVHIPAALVELGFATNTEDYKALTDSHYLDLAAQSLYDGLVAYKELLDKRFSPALKSPSVSSN